MRKIASIIAVAVGAISLNALPATAQDQLIVSQAGPGATERTIKRHSHVQEKTGAVEARPIGDRTSGRQNPWSDYSRHFHPRDR